MKSKAASLLNSRTRIQRTKDARFFSGWVRSFTEDQIQILLGPNSTIEVGEQFVIEVYGSETHAILHGRLNIVSENVGVFSLIEAPRFHTQKEPVRIRVEEINATVTALTFCDVPVPPDPFYVTVNDVSMEGAGIISPIKLGRGMKISLDVETPAGPVVRLGEIRYCKPEPQQEGLFRAGVLLEPMGRLELARWQKMLELASAAA